tara:strand:+ start:2250 stop:2795 length:546 start_codon:yes stop_codon:yes gene_type:complete
MGKRSSFKRRESDFYPTPIEAVFPLLNHLSINTKYQEPCCGELDLCDHLDYFGHSCEGISDIKGSVAGFYAPPVNAMDITSCAGEMFITNPPWPAVGQHGDPTIAMALHLSDIAPTWFLLNADVMHNKYFSKVADRCRRIVSVGRVKWISDSPGPGKENCAWFLFDPTGADGPIEFYPRLA